MDLLDGEGLSMSKSNDIIREETLMTLVALKCNTSVC